MNAPVGWWVCIGLAAGLGRVGGAPFPPNLIADGIPEPTAALRLAVAPYQEFRPTQLLDWHPRGLGMLVSTRHGNVAQLQRLLLPGGEPVPLTFGREPVRTGRYQPPAGSSLVFSRDSGGGEFFQLYRLNPADGEEALLTDGRSRNTGPRWSPGGGLLAYVTTRRNGHDTDLHVMDPDRPKTDRRIVVLEGGGWSVLDWSPDEQRLLVQSYVSLDRIDLFLVQIATGELRELGRQSGRRAVFAGGRFLPDGRSVITSTDEGSEFRRLARLDLATGGYEKLGGEVRGDVEEFELSPDGRRVAWIANEDGVGVLRWMELGTGEERRVTRIPQGVLSGLCWHPRGSLLGFTVTAAGVPGDVFAVHLKTRAVTRWTRGEARRAAARRHVEPERIRVRASDGLQLAGLLYRPNPGRFPGPRPVLVSIHGGPEAQARPVFQARWNYLIEERGIAILYPDVRGSTGYGRTFQGLDNGWRREDAVADLGVFLDWIRTRPDLDAGRVGTYGASYGGFMVLSSLVQFGDRLRCAVDVVGISSFPTFLRHTQDYRRELRRAEYGDERDPAMSAFLERISPLAGVERMDRPLLVVQGRNDPRVSARESDQLVQALRQRGRTVWYLQATDEGHGFAKKANADVLFLTVVRFLEEHLLP